MLPLPGITTYRLQRNPQPGIAIGKEEIPENTIAYSYGGENTNNNNTKSPVIGSPAVPYYLGELKLKAKNYIGNFLKKPEPTTTEGGYETAHEKGKSPWGKYLLLAGALSTLFLGGITLAKAKGIENKYNCGFFDALKGVSPFDDYTDPDKDGLVTSKEYELGTNPYSNDTDKDGVDDLKEYKYGTNPLNPDTDGDTLSDKEEIFKYHTNPLKVDTDNDGFPDDIELKVYENYGDPNDPNLPKDTDGDGYTDWFNENVLHVNPNKTIKRYAILVDDLPDDNEDTSILYKNFLVDVGRWKPENIKAFNWLRDLPEFFNMSYDEFWKLSDEELAKMYGGKEKYEELLDEAVKYSEHKFDSAIDEIASKVKPGDIVLITLESHGGPCTYEGYLNAYGKEEADRLKNMGYFDNPVVEKIGSRPLAEDIKKLEEKGAIVVGIINECYSGCYIKHLKDYKVYGNVVMITSTDAEHSSATPIVSDILDDLIDPEYAHPDNTIHKNFVSLKEAFEFNSDSRGVGWWEEEGYPQLYDPNNIAENTYLIEYPFSDTPFYRKEAVKIRKNYLGYGR